MSQLTVVAKVAAKAESLEELKSELLKLIEPTRKEEGCIAYNLHQDNEDPALFIFYETWQSSAALDMHMDSAHFKGFVEAAGGMIKEMAVHKMTRIA
jgi:quinol monooxygenase YgiN